MRGEEKSEGERRRKGEKIRRRRGGAGNEEKNRRGGEEQRSRGAEVWGGQSKRWGKEGRRGYKDKPGVTKTTSRVINI